MKSYLPVHDLIERMCRTWKSWLILAVVLGVCTLAVTAIRQPREQSVQATVNFSYEGIENGVNPMGGRFSADEMKLPQVLTAAAEAVGMELDEESLLRLQNSITITGNLPSGMISRITEYTSFYAEDTEKIKRETKQPGNTSEVRTRTYYPSLYTISLRCRDADMTAAQGTDFLNALLDSYQDYFVAYYGYNSAFEQALREFDYSNYDYEDAADVLMNNLNGLEDYLQWLSKLDKNRFVSGISGLSFGDLVDSIDLLKTQDLSWIKSYISANYLTKDRKELQILYQYKIEALERNDRVLRRRLATLSERIDSYVKDSALVISGTSGTDSPIYTVSQPSEMYNQLIADRVNCEASIVRNSESIAHYQQQIAEMNAAAESSVSMQKLKTLQEHFSLLDEQINLILNRTRETATEYFETVRLENAFAVLTTPAASSFWGQANHIVKSSIRPGISVAAILAGIYILSSVADVFLARKRRAADDSEAERTEAVSG